MVLMTAYTVISTMNNSGLLAKISWFATNVTALRQNVLPSRRCRASRLYANIITLGSFPKKRMG